MTRFVRAGFVAVAVLSGVAWVAAAPDRAPQGQTAVTGAGPADVCAPPAGGRGGGRGRGTAPARKRVLAWADSRNGRAQHEYVSYSLAQLQRLGHLSGAYDVIIRTDSDIIAFHPTMTDGKTPASGGPNLCNVDAIIYAGHRVVPLSAAQKADLVSAIKDRGMGFVTLFIGMLPNEDFPELANILGVKAASVDVHDPFPVSPIVNESPDSPMTRHLPAVWNLPEGSGYQPDFYDRKDIHVLLRKDLSKLAPVEKYTRTDGDYPMAWTKMYGKGKVFVSSIGNSPTLWDNDDLLKMYDEAIKWALGMTSYEVKPHPLPAGVKGPSK